MEKVCTTCIESKDVSEFGKQAKGKYGVRSTCHECTKEYGKKNRVRRREYYKKYAKEHRKTHINKKYEEEYREAYRNTFKGTVASMLAGARGRAGCKNLSYSLDSAWLKHKLEPMVCEATGAPLTLEIDKSVQHTPFRPSIDRIDPNLGYIKSNCRVVCVIFNKAKSDGTDEDVLTMAKYLLGE